METLSQDKRELINTIAKNEGFINYEIEANSGSMKGDGFLGLITAISIKEIDGKKELHLILKSSKSSKTLREQVPFLDRVYSTEINMYENVLPGLLEFQNQSGISNPFTCVAKIFGSSKDYLNECLVFENLKEAGYKLWNRKLPMNSDHVTLVFSEYAKYHAISMAFNELEPEKFKKITNNMVDVFEENGKNVHAHNKEFSKAVFEKPFAAVKDNQKATDALRRFYEELSTFMSEDLKNEDDHLVVTHGDCWCNNMMFKYEDIEDPMKPTKLCLIDWQLAKKGSPVMDLAYFFCASSSKETLYDIDKYLKVYHNVICDNLRNFGCDPDKIFPYSLLESHWKKYAKFGLFMALMIMKILISESGDVPDIQESENSERLREAFNVEPKIIEQYNQRVSDVIVFFTDKELI